MNPYAYTPIPDGPITLDLTGCKHWSELYRRIRQTFGLPTACGENWDAVWDCLTDVCLPDQVYLILVRGLDTVPEELQREVQTLRRILDDLQEECPLLRVEYC